MDADTWAKVVEIRRKLEHIQIDLGALYELTDITEFQRAQGDISQARHVLLQIRSKIRE